MPPATIGELAHIIAHSDRGPRGDPRLRDDERRSYANLILLCPTHHRLVDARPASYDVAKLREWKRAHEQWVHGRLAPSPPTVAVPDAVRLRVYRVGRPPIWRPAPTGGRLRGPWGDPQDAFTVLYASGSPYGSALEMLAPFASPARLDFSETGAADQRYSGVVPAEWFWERTIGSALFEGRLADPYREPMRHQLVGWLLGAYGTYASETDLLRLGTSADPSAWRVTQELSRVIYEMRDEEGRRRWDGIKFPSNPDYEEPLYALFHARVTEQVENRLDADHPAVQRAASALGLLIEATR